MWPVPAPARGSRCADSPGELGFDKCVLVVWTCCNTREELMQCGTALCLRGVTKFMVWV